MTAMTNICIDCQKACGGCSWTGVDPVTKKLRFEPVRGWTAEETIIRCKHRDVRRDIKSYHITACPEFVPDKKRGVSCGK